MRKFYLLIGIVFGFHLASSQNKSGEYPGVENISGSMIMKHISFFASEPLEGRMPAGNGYNKAANYAAEYFKLHGLIPYAKNSYFQDVPVEYNEFNGPIKLEKIEQGKVVQTYTLGSDFICRGFSGKGKFTASVVFCGYGLSIPEINYDDYANVDVKGKIVLVFKQNPAWAKDVTGIGEIMTRYRANLAAMHGAKAILFVTTPNMLNPQKPIGSIMDGKGIQNPDFPQMQISLELADALLRKTGKNLIEIQKQIDAFKKPFCVETGDSLHIEVNTKYEKERLTKNIIAVLPGTDDVLKNEYMIIGAHLDHVGKQDGLFFPGANDNASGSAAVLEIASAFVKSGISFKRTIIFVLFTSEELGMLGSKYFVEHTPVPLEKVVAMFNLDCIGHGDSIQVGGGISSPQLWKKTCHFDSVYTKLLIPKSGNGGGADAQPFFDKGIPTLYFASKYSYTYLHLPGDTPETLNPDLLEKMAKLAYLIAADVANGNYTKEKLPANSAK